MSTFVKIFREEGGGAESRLESAISEFAERNNLEIVSASACFHSGFIADVMFIIVVYKRKEKNT